MEPYGSSHQKGTPSPRRVWRGAAPAPTKAVRSPGTLQMLLGCRGGYTSPRRRRNAESLGQAMQSLCDASWEGDSDGVAVLLENLGEEEAGKPGWLLGKGREGLGFNQSRPMAGFVALPAGAGGEKATPLAYAVAARKTKTVETLLHLSPSNVSTGLSPRTIAVANTFWLSQASARPLRLALWERSPPTEAEKALRTPSSVTAWLISVGVRPMVPTLQNGGELQEMLAEDWRKAGMTKLVDLKKLFVALVKLMVDGCGGVGKQEEVEEKGDPQG